MAVEVDADHVYEPDALVRCGLRLADNAAKLDNPAIDVEILSPSTQTSDSATELADHFRLSMV